MAPEIHLAEEDADTGDDEQQWEPEDPAGLDDAAAADGGGFGGVKTSEHDDEVVADGGVVAESDAAEEVDDVFVHGGVVAGAGAAEEVHNIVMGLAVDVDVAEEDDDVAIDFALNVGAAEEADDVVGGSSLFDVDGGAELNVVLCCACRARGEERN